MKLLFFYFGSKFVKFHVSIIAANFRNTKGFIKKLLGKNTIGRLISGHATWYLITASIADLIFATVRM